MRGRNGLQFHIRKIAEIEADRVADTVMRMPEGNSINGWPYPFAEKTASLIQRKAVARGRFRRQVK